MSAILVEIPDADSVWWKDLAVGDRFEIATRDQRRLERIAVRACAMLQRQFSLTPSERGYVVLRAA